MFWKTHLDPDNTEEKLVESNIVNYLYILHFETDLQAGFLRTISK